MRIALTKEIVEATQKAVKAAGTQKEFERKTHVPQSSISLIIGIKDNYDEKQITDSTYLKLEPHLKPFLPTGYSPFHDISEQEEHTPPVTRNTIRNTPELRECIKDAMLEQGIRGASELCKQIGYDTPGTLERLLSGKINWFPDMLSAVLDNLKINHDDAPMSPAERGLLQPEGIYYNDGTPKTRAVLVHYQPVISWANAASYIDCLISNDGAVMKKWNPDEVEETVPVPLDIRGVCSIFRISGQSMEPAINDGDIIYCEQVMDLHTIPDKRVVVVKFSDCNKFEDCIVCKRFRRIGDKILLTSDNPAGREFELEPQDIAWIGILRKLTKNGDSI